MKYGKIVNGIVEVIAMFEKTILDPKGTSVFDPKTNTTTAIARIPNPAFIAIPDDVFAGDTANADGTFTAQALPPKPFLPLPRAAFLFMAKKLGLVDADIRGLIASMPATTPAEIDAKDIALLVYENQQMFDRDNALLKTLVAKTPLTSKQVDVAWRKGEAIKW